METVDRLIEQSTERRIERREFLRRAVALGLSLPAAGALLAACAPAAAPTPTAAPKTEPKPAAPTAPPSKPQAQPTAAPQPAAAPQPTAAAAAKPPAPAGRLIFALNTWLTGTPFGWRSTTAEKQIWDPVYDSLIMRDPKSAEYTPGLATDWKPSADYKSWTFKLRQGIMFHGEWGELTSADVKFTVEQNLKPDANGSDAGFFKSELDGIETPDKYTVVMRYKHPLWEVPSHFSQLRGYQNIVSKKHLEALGEEKAAQNPIGTGPYRHVEGRQGDFQRFEAVQNHWRQTPAFKELVVRRVQEAGATLAGLRTGEIDIAAVTGDFLKQARSAGLRIVESPNAQQFWIVLPGQTVPKYEDYCPTCPWVGDLTDPKGLENAKKVRLALNLAVNKKAIYDNLWNGLGGDTPYSYYYYPFHKGYSTDWKVPPYDPQRARQLLAEAGVPNGFEIKMNPLAALDVDVADILEAVILDWDRIGVRVKRVPEELGTFSPKGRQRKTGVTGRSYSPPAASDEPVLSWGRTLSTKGTFNLLAEGPFDDQLEAIAGELDPERRVKLTAALATQLYQEYRGVMIGMKSATWAVTKKVGNWPLLPYTPYVSNHEYITSAAQ